MITVSQISNQKYDKPARLLDVGWAELCSQQ